MTTRLLYLNKNAAAPAGLPTSKQFRFMAPGGARLNADNVTIEDGKINEFINMVDGGLYGAPSNANYAVVETINGVKVARFDPTLTPGGGVGYSLNNLGMGAVNAGQYSFAALWKVTDGFPAKPREIIAAAFVALEARAALREDDSGVPEARAQRATGAPITILSIPTPVRIGGWIAAAADFDWTNDTLTIHDLLGSTSVSGAIGGTAGAAPSDINTHRIGYFAATNERFVGYLADHKFMAYLQKGPLLTALRLHMRARATKLAGL